MTSGPTSPSTTSSPETTPSDQPKRPVVGAAILDSQDSPRRLLAARRSAPEILAGLWEFPGGKIEPGELAQEALIREVKEELGVEIGLGEEIAADHSDGWLLANGARMRVFEAWIVDGEPAPLEDHDLLEWTELSHDALYRLEWIPADTPIVDALIARFGR
ncbi:MAG: (deoxy)nucleoside triphosphate pyrophosphohydrolase [Micrococcaceae bacterium]